MEIIAINGSPRKNGNTVTMCKYFLEGAVSSVANVNATLINLYELNYTGCVSCFGCKRIKGNNYGKCIVKDDIYELLRKAIMADALAVASPMNLKRQSTGKNNFRLTVKMFLMQVGIL